MTNLVSTYIVLPLDIIDCIIIANPATIVSTYNAIISNRKRKRNNETNYYYNNLLDYILDNKQNYLKKSPYFKYLDDINQSIEIYTLLTKYIKKANIPVFTNTDIALSNIEANILEYVSKSHSFTAHFSKSNDNVITKYTQYLYKLVDIYKLNTITELPDFIKIYLLLKSCNYLPLNKDFFNYVNNQSNSFMAIIDIILEKEENIIYAQTLLEGYLYLLQPEYKFIPLFNIYLGMGYNFMIGYDMILDRLIGFINGGGCAQEYEYNTILIEKYLKLDYKQRLIKYQKNCSRNKNNKLLVNIQKYLELFNIDIKNLLDFNYFNDMHLNILDN